MGWWRLQFLKIERFWGLILGLLIAGRIGKLREKIAKIFSLFLCDLAFELNFAEFI